MGSKAGTWLPSDMGKPFTQGAVANRKMSVPASHELLSMLIPGSHELSMLMFRPWPKAIYLVFS